MTDDLDWLRWAYRLATLSPDPSSQNAAVLHGGDDDQVISGINAPPRGLDMSTTDWRRPNKYGLVEHAERQVLYAAAAAGRPTLGATMVVCWAACADCARGIVQAGVTRLVRHARHDGAWKDSVRIGDRILRAGGVDVVDIDGPVPGAPTVRFNGGTFNPNV